MLRNFGKQVKSFQRVYSIKKKTKAIKTSTKTENNVVENIKLPDGFNQGIHFLNEGKFVESFEEFAKLKVENPVLKVFNQFHKGLALFYQQNFKQAIKEFELCDIPEDFPKEMNSIVRSISIVLPYYIGLSYLQLQNFQECLNYMNYTISLDPKFAFAYFYKAICHFEFQQYSECNISIEEALNIDKSYIESIVRSSSPMDISKIHKIFEDDKEMKYYQLSLLERRAMCYVELDNKSLAIATIQKGLDLDPNNVSFNLNRAFLLFQSGNIDETLEAVDKCLELSPNNLDCFTIKARIYTFDKKDIQKTTEISNEALKHYPDKIEFEFYKAFVNFENNKIKEAEKIIDDIESKGYELEDVTLLKGQILTNKKEFKEAIQCFDRVLAVNDVNPDAMYTKAYCLVEIGKPKEAKQILEILSDIEPTNNRSHALLNHIDKMNAQITKTFGESIFNEEVEKKMDTVEKFGEELEKLIHDISKKTSKKKSTKKKSKGSKLKGKKSKK